MADSAGGGLCRCCSSFIFTSGLTALFMWLSLRADSPKCSIDYFYLPGLNKTLNQPSNTTLYFELKLQNPNKDKGIYYDDVKVNVTVSDTAQNGSYVLGNEATIPRFYQGHKKKARKKGEVGYNKTVVARGVFPNGTAYFRLDMATAVRYKILWWKTKRHRISVGAKVEMNENGTKVNPRKKKDVKLSMAPTPPGCGGTLLFLGFFVHFLVFNLI